MVPRRGLEPPRVASHVPETCVSTNFTTSARGAVFLLRLGKRRILKIRHSLVNSPELHPLLVMALAAFLMLLRFWLWGSE